MSKMGDGGRNRRRRRNRNRRRNRRRRIVIWSESLLGIPRYARDEGSLAYRGLPQQRH